MKRYTMEELREFCTRADTDEKREIARKWIVSRPLNITEEQRAELLEILAEDDFCDFDEVNPFLPDYMDRDEKPYGPSNPWDAPGMKLSDFITGVSFF